MEASDQLSSMTATPHRRRYSDIRNYGFGQSSHTSLKSYSDHCPRSFLVASSNFLRLPASCLVA